MARLPQQRPSLKGAPRERSSDDPPAPITRIPAPSQRRRRGGTRRPRSRSSRGRSLPPSIVAAILLIPLVAGVLLTGRDLIAGRDRPQEIPLARYEVVTATQPPTPLLPLEYILALSATPTPDFSPTAVVGADGPDFITATPSFTLATSGIVYVCFVDGNDDLCRMNADGTGYQRLTEQSGTDWYPSFSHDFQRIVYSSQGGTGNFDIYIMEADGSGRRQLTRNHAHNYAPALSPDGRWIVFTSTFGATEGEQNIWLMASDGSLVTQLTFEPEDDIDPMWSPDGREISFASNRNGTTELFVMDASGTNVRQLTHNVNIGGRNDWSPDGRWLTFYAGPTGDKNIYLVDSGCGAFERGCGPEQLSQLTDGGNNKGPSFSPDGQWIVYTSGTGRGNEIYIMRTDGSQKTRLTFNNYSDWQPRWRP